MFLCDMKNSIVSKLSAKLNIPVKFGKNEKVRLDEKPHWIKFAQWFHANI